MSPPGIPSRVVIARLRPGDPGIKTLDAPDFAGA